MHFELSFCPTLFGLHTVHLSIAQVYAATRSHLPGCSASVTTNPKHGILCSSGAALTVKGPSVHLQTGITRRQQMTAK